MVKLKFNSHKITRDESVYRNAGWNFDTIWEMTGTYPTLQCFNLKKAIAEASVQNIINEIFE